MDKSQVKSRRETARRRQQVSTKSENFSVSNARFNYSTFNLRFSLLFFSLSCSPETNQGSTKKCERKTAPKPATHNRVGKFFDLSNLLSYFLENLLTLRGHHTGGGEDKRGEISVLYVANAVSVLANLGLLCSAKELRRGERGIATGTTLISKYACRILLQNPTHFTSLRASSYLFL